MFNRILKVSLITAAFASAMTNAAETKLTVGGFVKLDAYYDNKVNSSVGPRGYDLLDYRGIPLDGTPNAERAGGFKAHARASRFYLQTATPYMGDTIKTHIEGDFFGKVDAGSLNDDDTLSNSYELRLRQAYVTWGNWKVGQAWSNFVDLKAYPEGMDFTSLVGRTFLRQAQVTYTHQLGGGDRLSFSLENPETDYNADHPAPGANARESESMPDIIATYFNTTDWGHFRASGVVRRLGTETFTNDTIAPGTSSNAMAYGIGLSSKINFNKQFNLKLNFVGGPGIGRYLYSNHYRSAVLTPEGELEVETAWGANAMLQYKPSADLRFNIGYGINDMGSGEDFNTHGSVNTEQTTIHGNAVYTILPKLNVGVGFTHAAREVADGREGDITRFMFYVKKDFKASF
jgi:hypothetical protein